MSKVPVTAPVIKRCGRLNVVRTEWTPLVGRPEGLVPSVVLLLHLRGQMKVLLSPEPTTLRSGTDILPLGNPDFGRTLEGKVMWITGIRPESDRFPPHESHLSLW